MNINLHVDCDPLWVYASEYGLTPDYRNARTYEESLPELLELLQARNLRATFFAIGRDLELPACRDFLGRALAAGHNVANHTYSHLKNFHSASPDLQRREIVGTHEAIRRELRFECRGIRFPGYYFDRTIIPVLQELGYIYDTSVLPGPAVHMMAADYLLHNRGEREKRFGRPWFLFAPSSPYRIAGRDGKTFWEIPVGTAPLVRLPMHTTFVFQWGMSYFEWALALNRKLSTNLVYLFHAIDLLDGSGTGPLEQAVIALRRPIAERRAWIARILDALSRETIVTTEQMLAARTASEG
jgi:peptidoglycan-N-acetylglucosamine deacetylase